MKTKLLLFSLFVYAFVFAQSTVNQSTGGVQPSISTPIGPQFGTEIFRFRSGIVTQLDAGSQFDFTTSQWFALGRVGANNVANQNFYGLRFQQPNRAIVMGYTTALPNNPRIEWIGTGASLGSLEFRVGDGFGVTGNPGNNTVVATMTRFGNTIFGPNVLTGAVNSNPFLNGTNQPRVGVFSNNNVGLSVLSSLANATSIVASGGSVGVQANGTNTGVIGNGSIGVTGIGNSVGVSGNGQSNGVEGFGSDVGVFGGGNIAVLGKIAPNGSGFTAAIFGETGNPSAGNGSNEYAGFFNGDVATTAGVFLPSDSKLKNEASNETNILEKINQLRPVNYTYKSIDGIKLATGKQHGFISQELAEIFPELTKDISKPVFDKENKVTSSLDYKAINYIGLISVLTAGIQELSKEMEVLKDELAEYKSNELMRSSLNNTQNLNVKGFSMEQNVPNPFADQTQIAYQLPSNSTRASIIVFDLNGRLVKEYELNQNSGLLNIKSSDIGKGMFFYTLVNNGSEIITKKMIVK